MGMLDCDWDSLCVEATRYLKNYDEDIRIDTTTARYDRGPQVDAILPLKGKKEVLRKLKSDKRIIVRRGYTENGMRFARISVICEKKLSENQILQERRSHVI